MDAPLRIKLLIAFVAVAFLNGLLTTVAGTLLINRLVVGEAQRRVQLGLKTAEAMLGQEAGAGLRVTGVLAAWSAQDDKAPAGGLSKSFLERVRVDNRLDFLQVLDAQGTVILTARGQSVGRKVDSPLVRAALAQGTAGSGLRLIPIQELAIESPALAARAQIKILPTAHAKQVPSEPLREAMVIETVSPIIGPRGRFLGAVRSGLMLNQHYDLVDTIRENIFTTGTYKNKNFGTVTIFQRDVRIATNVTDEQGKRGVGTRISAEVYDRVLGEGKVWIGPALVINNWYISSYEPIRDVNNRIIGVLYVGILKDRYDDLRSQTAVTFLLIAALALALAVGVAYFLAWRLSRPLTSITAAAAAIARGDMQYRIATPTRARRDEAKQLLITFGHMTDALRERDEQLRRSYERLQATTQELHRWNQNYLETLEFITHELKNQIAAMKLNVLAIRDGYVGELAPAQYEALEDVAATLRRTEEMILNYLNLSRIEKGELEVKARPLNLRSDVLETVLREMNSQLSDQQMRLELALPEGLAAQGDPSLLQIVFANLVGNAAKYGREGGLLRISGERQGEQVLVRFWNDGPGVPPEEMEMLFQRFSRLSGGEVKQRGTGLGLFIAREIVTRHGGELRVASEYPKWIEFVVLLPAADLDEEDTETIG